MATTNGGSIMLALASIAASKTNPRKTFDEAFLKELAASITQYGVLQPILVRPLEKKNGQTHEVVAGEQRWRAAKAAGLTEIPVIVRTLSDNEAKEIQIVENLQRKDVHPMEEGVGYRVLLDMKDAGKPVYDVPALAARVSKSESYIWQRLKLAELIPAGQDLFQRNVISTEHAILVARLNEEQQKRTLAETVRKSQTSADYEVHTVRQLRQYIFEKVYRSLDKAPFPKDDGTLNPKAPGPEAKCIGCKFNTGATPGLYQDVSGNCCSFEPCFETKMSAFLTRKQRELAKESGGEVLAITRDSKWGLGTERKDKLVGVLTSEQFEETKHNAKGAKKAIVVDGRGRGEVTYIVPRKVDARGAAAPTPGEKTRRLEERKVELEGRIENDTARAVIERIAKKVRPNDRECLLDVLAWGIDRSYHTDEILKLLDRVQPAAAWIPKAGGEAGGRVFKESTKGYRDRLAKLKPDQLAQAAAVIAGVNARWHDYSMTGEGSKLKALAETAARFRIDVKAVGRQVRETFKVSFGKIADAKKKVHDRPAKKKAAPLILAPGQIALQIKQASGFPRTVAGWRVGQYLGVYAEGTRTPEYFVSHLPTGLKVAPHTGDTTGYLKRETAMFVATRLATHGDKWNFLLATEAANLPDAMKADVKRLSNDKVAAKEAAAAPTPIATPAARATAAKVTGPTAGKPNGTTAHRPAVTGLKVASGPGPAASARKTTPVKRSAVQTSAARSARR